MMSLLPAIRSLERRARYLFYCMFVCLFGQRFLSNPRADSRHILHAGVAWVGTCLLPFWGQRPPWGAKRGKMTWGWSHSCIGQLPFLFLSAMLNVVQYVGHRPAQCAHSGVEPSRSSKAFLQGGPKNSKKFRIFHYFETLRPYISETIKNRGI